MALYKPSWLRDFLNRFNFDIFTWHVYIGDVVETAVDWTIEGINNALDWGVSAYNLARSIIDTFKDRVTAAISGVINSVNYALNWIYSWPSRIASWWDGAKGDFKDWVRTLLYDVNSAISSVGRTANSLSTKWQDFVTSTLPGLLDWSWVRSFFGAGIASISDWWRPQRDQLRDERQAELQPVIERVNEHDSWLDSVRELFSDPEKWLLDRIESMLARFL